MISEAPVSRPWMKGIPSTPPAVGTVYTTALVFQPHCTDAITEARDGQGLFQRHSQGCGFPFCNRRRLDSLPFLLRSSCLHPDRHLVPPSQAQSDKEGFPSCRGSKLTPDTGKDGPPMHQLWGTWSFPSSPILFSACLVPKPWSGISSRWCLDCTTSSPLTWDRRAQRLAPGA